MKIITAVIITLASLASIFALCFVLAGILDVSPSTNILMSQIGGLGFIATCGFLTAACIYAAKRDE